MHFPLHPETPAEGRALEELFRGRGVDLEAMYARMKGLMDAEGLPYGRRTHTYNSRLAQELGKWADGQDGGEAFHEAMYRAYFVEARNIAEEGVLVEIAQAAGLDVAAARQVLHQRSHREAVDADWQKSRDYGVTGVPTFVAARHGVVGAQPYEVLAQLLEQVGAKRRDGDNGGEA